MSPTETDDVTVVKPEQIWVERSHWNSGRRRVRVEFVCLGSRDVCVRNADTGRKSQIDLAHFIKRFSLEIGQ